MSSCACFHSFVTRASHFHFPPDFRQILLRNPSPGSVNETIPLSALPRLCDLTPRQPVSPRCRKALNEQKEMKLLLDMYKGVGKEQRDKVQLMAADKKARQECDDLRMQLKRFQVRDVVCEVGRYVSCSSDSEVGDNGQLGGGECGQTGSEEGEGG